MSAARLCTTRLVSLIALAALALFAGCTTPTPLYCDTTDPGAPQCAPPYTCTQRIHTCEIPEAGSDTGATGGIAGATGGDAGVDKPMDGGTGEDHPIGTDGSDGPRSDASDASADVFHPCSNNLGCSDPTKPACQVDAGVCVGCVQSSDCKAAGAHACDTAVNKCVECVANADCANATKPICDNQTCRGCKVDSECVGGPGVCMSHLDGHCATDSETVYVSKTGCNDAPDGGVTGTSQTPYCTSQLAFDSTALPPPPPSDAGVADGGNKDGGGATDGSTGIPASGKTLVVMRGPSPLTQWAFNDANRTITVVGQLGAKVSPGANIGIHVSGGTVYIRSLLVSGGMGTDAAIVADGNSTLHLDRSIVDGNMKGGILINGAAYDITNTVVANNGSTSTIPGCGGWAGVCIMSRPVGALGRFLNNTVISNKQVGVACDATYPVLGSIVSDSTGGLDVVGCSFTSCCTSTTINVDPTTYHLTAGSSCIDQLQSDMSIAYDLDGTPRPSGPKSDCGAFEYVAP